MSSHGCSAAALPSAAAAVATSTAVEPGATGAAGARGPRGPIWISVTALLTARQGIRGASSSTSAAQPAPTASGS